VEDVRRSRLVICDPNVALQRLYTRFSILTQLTMVVGIVWKSGAVLSASLSPRLSHLQPHVLQGSTAFGPGTLRDAMLIVDPS